MTEENHADSKAFGWSMLLLTALVVGFLGFLSTEFASPQFEDNAGEKALAALGTLFVIALFVERAQEVFVSAWRTLGREQIEAKVAELRRDGTDTAEVRAQESRHREYRHKTRQMAFLVGMILGVLISFVGPRILEAVIPVSTSLTGWQTAVFHGVDILITGGLIGGGSDGIHKLVTLITDFLEQTRDRAKRNADVETK